MTAASAGAGLAAALGGIGLIEALATRPRRRRSRNRVGAAIAATLARIGRGAGGRAALAPTGDGQRLESAGLTLSPADFAALRLGAVLVALLAAVPVAAAAPPRSAVVLLLVAPLAARAGPALWLRRRTRRRARAVERELPDVLDLVRVATGAGLSPMRALAEVGRRHPGVLAAELQRAARRRALGLPAATVVDELERRCPGDGVGALCAALRRAERHGAPLAGALAAQAREARARETARTAEAAARAAPRIQLAVALLLVPPVLLLVAAGLLPALTGR
jgi:tight adherence protein C